MIAPGERPSDHNPYEKCEAKNHKTWRRFHVLSLHYRQVDGERAAGVGGAVDANLAAVNFDDPADD